MEFFKKTDIDFIGWRYLPIGCSIAIMVSSLALLIFKGPNYSIEFTGGTVLQVTFQKPLTLGQVRSALDKKGFSPEIQSVSGKPTFILREKGSKESVDTLSTSLTETLREAFPDDPLNVDRREYIGPVVGGRIKTQTLWAILGSLGAILVYVGFRFDNPLWGAAGVIALFHDVIGAAGFCVLMGKEFDLLIVSALLTIAGYSISDTIVIFDRMREMQRLMRKDPIDKVINVAINDTLSRTIITELTVQIVCVVLALYGGEVLHNFAMAMVIGNFLGSYSSIAVAAPLVYEWEVWKRRK